MEFVQYFILNFL